MIKNERDYRITHAQAEKFRAAIAKATDQGPPKGVAPRLHTAEIDGMRSQLASLEQELKSYDELKTLRGKKRIEGSDLAELLIKARIARGWTQAELAAKVGLHMQKIQEYEQRAYDRASLTRITQILQALGVTMSIRLELVALPSLEEFKRKSVATK